VKKMEEFFKDTSKLYEKIKELSNKGEVDELIKLLERYDIKPIWQLNIDLRILSRLHRIIASVNWLLKEKELEVRKIESEIADLYSLLRIFRDELAKLDYTSAFFVYDKLTNLLDEIKERKSEKLNEKLDTNLKDKLLQELLTNDDIIREKVKEEEQRWNKGKINLEDIGLLRFLQNTKVLSKEERNSILDTKISTHYFQILKRKLYELENILYSELYKKDITC
jgi:hypothetical protein